MNGDSLTAYFGFFNYERGLFYQANALLANGLLYKWFSTDELKNLQLIASKLNLTTSNFINQSIAQRRELAANASGFKKTEAVQFVNFIETELNATRKLLDDFITII